MPPFTRSQARNAIAAHYPVGGGEDLVATAPQTTNQAPTTARRQTDGTSSQAQSVWSALSSLSTLTDLTASVESITLAEPRASCMRQNGEVQSAWPTLSSPSTLTESAASQESAKPRTPENPVSWTPGSVMLTPRKLGPSPKRIGGHDIDFWRDGSGVIVHGIVDEQSSSQDNQDLAARSQRNREVMQGFSPILARKIGERERQIQAEFEASQITNGGYERSLDRDLLKENSFSLLHPNQTCSQRLGPEGTILIDSESQNSAHGSHILGLQPTEIIGEEQQQSTSRRTFPPRLNPPLKPQPTELC